MDDVFLRGSATFARRGSCKCAHRVFEIPSGLRARLFANPSGAEHNNLGMEWNRACVAFWGVCIEQSIGCTSQCSLHRVVSQGSTRQRECASHTRRCSHPPAGMFEVEARETEPIQRTSLHMQGTTRTCLNACAAKMRHGVHPHPFEPFRVPQDRGFAWIGVHTMDLSALHLNCKSFQCVDPHDDARTFSMRGRRHISRVGRSERTRFEWDMRRDRHVWCSPSCFQQGKIRTESHLVLQGMFLDLLPW